MGNIFKSFVKAVDPTSSDSVFGGGSRFVDFVESGVDQLTGKDAADAIKEGEEAQLLAGNQAIAAQERALAVTRGDLEPFRQFGTGALPILQGALDDPSARVLNNPFFTALASDQEQRLLSSAAARGKVGSGGTDDALKRNLLLLGQQFSQQDITNLQNQASTGLNAAARTGQATQATAQQTSNILLQGGNVQAASGIAQANAQSQGFRDILGFGAAIAPVVFSDVRLKENIEFSHAENGIRMYNWSWTEDAKKIVGDQGTHGPLAQELRKTHPELVTTDTETGFLKVLM